MTSTSFDEPNSAKKTSHLQLWLVLLVCVMPFFAAVILHMFWTPSSQMNYGELVEPVPLPDDALTLLTGGSLQMSSLRGKWILAQVDQGTCDPYCVEKLWKMRQLRLTQGKNMSRIERLWLISDESAVREPLLTEYQGQINVRAGESFIHRFPKGHDLRDHIWIIDPLGNIFMRYPRGADPSLIKNDLIRLLKVSQIG